MNEKWGMDELINSIKRYRKICWYPSAGSDFRPFLFLSNAFYKDYSQVIADQYPDHDRVIPDLFVFSDVNIPNIVYYKVSNVSGYTDADKLNDPRSWRYAKTLYSDPYTYISIDKKYRFEDVIQEIKRNHFDPDYKVSKNYGNAFLMDVTVSSLMYKSRMDNGRIKTWKTKFLYIIGENAAVAKELFLKNSVDIDSVVLIRYGDGFGHAELGAQWVESLFRHLHTNYLVANDRYVRYDEECFNSDIKLVKEYFAPYDLTVCPEFEEIYHMDGHTWSSYGEVKWCKVKY